MVWDRCLNIFYHFGISLWKCFLNCFKNDLTQFNFTFPFPFHFFFFFNNFTNNYKIFFLKWNEIKRKCQQSFVNFLCCPQKLCKRFYFIFFFWWKKGFKDTRKKCSSNKKNFYYLVRRVNKTNKNNHNGRQ